MCKEERELRKGGRVDAQANTTVTELVFVQVSVTGFGMTHEQRQRHEKAYNAVE